MEPGPHGRERLIQGGRHIGVAPLGKECALDCVTLLVRESRDCMPESTAALGQSVGVMRIFLRASPFARQMLDRSGAGQIHDPAHDATLLRVIIRGPAPHLVKNLQRQFLGSLPGVDDSHEEREHEPVRPFIEGVQGQRIAGSNASDDLQPVGFRSDVLRLIRVQQIAQGRIVVMTGGTHGPQIVTRLQPPGKNPPLPVRLLRLMTASCGESLASISAASDATCVDARSLTAAELSFLASVECPVSERIWSTLWKTTESRAQSSKAPAK
jgi:hypothetical protein